MKKGVPTIISETINRATCGPHGYSVCARLYQGHLKGKTTHTYLCIYLDNTFWWEVDHCKKSWEKRQGNKDGT